MNRHLAYLALLLFMVPSLRAEGGELPATLSVEGKGPLTLASQAARRDLLGAVELYTIALYTDRGAVSREILASPDVAKALRIQVSYEEDLRRKLVIDWRRELVPRLDSAATAHIQGSIAPIQHGDTVIVEYVPGRGTTVRVNRGVAVSGANHDLMLTFLDHWIGQRPLSEEIRHALLSF
jgi:hypothetical protein